MKIHLEKQPKLVDFSNYDECPICRYHSSFSQYHHCLLYVIGRTPEDIRKNFNIVVDFTPEEEAQLREDNKWALEEL